VTFAYRHSRSLAGGADLLTVMPPVITTALAVERAYSWSICLFISLDLSFLLICSCSWAVPSFR